MWAQQYEHCKHSVSLALAGTNGEPPPQLVQVGVGGVFPLDETLRCKDSSSFNHS